MLANNPDYKLETTVGPYSIYTPVDIANGYTTARYVEAMNQQIYSNAGANAEVLKGLADQLIERANSTYPIDTIRTDMGLIGQNIAYRLEHPVDQHCAIRMGAILSFIEYTDAAGNVVSEDPETYVGRFTALKEQLAHDNPDLYAFFLSWGIDNTPLYREVLHGLTEPDYFRRRDEMLRILLPTPNSLSAAITKTSTSPA